MSYTKTIWQDLPNTTTPINATNLNKMEQGIYDANDKNVITIGLNADTSFTSTANYQSIDVNLTNEVGKTGTKLSLSNGKVSIGAGVTKVLISGAMQTQGDGNMYGLSLYKNNNTIAQAFVSPPNSSYNHLSVVPIIVSVAQNDTIKMGVYINTSGSTKNLKAYNGGGTYLTVEVIE